MPILARLRSLWRNLLHRTHADAELDDELRAYVALLAEEYERAGMTGEDALRRARIETGGVQQVKESTRDAWVGAWVTTFGRELRYALRSLRRSPAFVVISITTLALGIGGATAVFTVIKGSLLRPLPGVAESDRLITVDVRVQGRSEAWNVSYPDYRDLRERSTTLAGLAGYNGTSMAIVDTAGARTQAMVGFVSDNFFSVLGVHPVVGRVFAAAPSGARGALDDQVVVLGYDWWQQHFGGDARIIGTTLAIGGGQYTIIGVAPKGFGGAMALYPMEMWIPVVSSRGTAPELAAYNMRVDDRHLDLLFVVGRLAPGRTVDDARRDLGAIGRWLAATYQEDRKRSIEVLPRAGMDAEERATMSRVPRLLVLSVTLLLLIACGNVASLSLVRSAARRRELATRIALGASRAALVRQVVVEGVVLAAAAGVLGIAIAQLLVSSATLVNTVAPMPGVDVSMDARVLAVAIASSACTAILVSLLPALQIFHLQPGSVLKDGGGAVRGHSAGGQRALVGAQVAASLVLLSGAAIIFSAFQRVLDARFGIDPRGITDAWFEVQPVLHEKAQQRAFYRAVLARATSEPNIEAVALTNTVPPFQWSGTVTVFRRGEEPPPGPLTDDDRARGFRVNDVTVSPDFFDVMRIPLLRGRTFATSDNEQSAPVVIVSRRMADMLWPGQEAIGRLLALPTSDEWPRSPLRVIGVVGDIRNVSLTDVPLAMYVPFAQHLDFNLSLVARGRENASIPPSTFRRIVADVDPSIDVHGTETLTQRLSNEVRPQRAASAWIGTFGVIALLLAAVGLYGVMAQAVLQRTRELAVRSALGASPGGILRTVIRDGLRLAAIGGAVGALGAFVAFRVLRSLFTGVQLTDMRAVIVAVFTLGVAMLAATYLPARRAARLNPVDALRSD
ncbi:MAG TPA: ADOP family duplicated permease [Gemmatimonadaceae bacterium]|nr:ADOP family duplicated permease [Gemmatimonadaceae bacterium]